MAKKTALNQKGCSPATKEQGVLTHPRLVNENNITCVCLGSPFSDDEVKDVEHARMKETDMAADRSKALGMGVKPVPMKLFATWEVEKSSPNCIPRLCNLTLTRLVILRPLENDLTSVILAVKMQSSKRILRSNEILMPSNGLLDTELDLSFSLQYPHFLKRDGNKLHVMLQRRKKYKNRTILGYKTLAIGQVNMAQVLQQSVDRELNMYSDLKERTNKVAQIMMLSLSSQPVDHEENGRFKLRSTEIDRSPDVDLSDDDEGPEDDDGWSNDEMSDSDQPMHEDDTRMRTRTRKSGRGPNRPAAINRQRNIKQKFIALLKRFKVSEEDSEQDPDLAVHDVANQQEIEDLFDELEDLSDSGPDMDTISVLSTPKPKLRPFFTGKGSSQDILDIPKDSGRLSDGSSKHYDSDSHLDNLTDQGEASDSPEVILGSSPAHKYERGSQPVSPALWAPSAQSMGHTTTAIPTTTTTITTAANMLANRERCTSMREKKGTSSKRELVDRRNSAGNAEAIPRKVLLDQLSSVLSSDESLPKSFILVNANEWQGQLLAQAMQEPQHRVICTCSSADVKASISFVVNKIQKFCNSNARSPAPIKVAIAGGDGYMNLVLRPYVEQFSAKSHDWQNYIKFLFIPLGSSSLGKFLGALDSTYNSMFQDATWKDTFEKSENQRSDMSEIVNRVTRYLNSASHVLQLPIAEAMITYKEKRYSRTDEESSQIFVPFINEVRIGPIDIVGAVPSTSVDLDEVVQTLAAQSGSSSGSPPQSAPPTSSSGGMLDKAKDSHTPPSSPNINNPFPGSGATSQVMSPSGVVPPEFLDLQIDYWTTETKQEMGPREKLVKKDSKSSLKSAFKSILVYRLPPQSNVPADGPSSTLSMMVVTKEKKQKIMRIGKKSKEGESRSQVVDGINRLICTSKSQSHPLTVTIDGVDWNGVKFFQLSAQWQTHIKHIPLITFSTENTAL